MKKLKLIEGLELRHSSDGFTLAFTPKNGKGGAILNMSKIANDRGGITRNKLIQVMAEIMDLDEL